MVNVGGTIQASFLNFFCLLTQVETNKKAFAGQKNAAPYPGARPIGWEAITQPLFNNC